MTYNFRVDSDGDAVEDVTIQIAFGKAEEGRLAEVRRERRRERQEGPQGQGRSARLVDRIRLVPCSTTGEFTTLSPEEYRRVIELYVSAAAGRIPVIAGVGALSTGETIGLAQYREQVGADAIMLVPPFYDPLSFEIRFRSLLPEFSALENVVIPQLILGRGRKAAEARARALLTNLGLGDRIEHRPAELSGGEQQRTAICRGLANAPKLLLADEPTGNLDPHTSEHVFRELIDLIRQQGVAALIATHNMDLARRMDRVLLVQEGRLVEISAAKAL